MVTEQNRAAAWQALRSAARRCWQVVRRLSGDDAYDQYLAHTRNAHPHAVPQSRRDFELERQQRKWNRISRCC